MMHVSPHKFSTAYVSESYDLFTNRRIQKLEFMHNDI